MAVPPRMVVSSGLLVPLGRPLDGIGVEGAPMTLLPGEGNRFWFLGWAVFGFPAVHSRVLHATVRKILLEALEW